MTEPKTGVARKIPVHDDLLKALKTHQKRQDWHKERIGDKYEDSGWIIGGSFGGAIIPNISHLGIIKIYCSGRDRQELYFTHTSLLLLGSINPKIVQERLGHASIEMTLDIYLHLLSDGYSGYGCASSVSIFGR